MGVLPHRHGPEWNQIATLGALGSLMFAFIILQLVG